MYSAVLITLIFINIFNGGNTIKCGERAEPQTFTFMVSLRIVTNNVTSFCGGVVIDEYHILTAAHCVESSKPEEVSLHIGVQSITPFDLEYWVEEIHVHQNHKRGRYLTLTERCLAIFMPCCIDKEAIYYEQNDIAILKIRRKLTFGDHLTKVELPESDMLPYCTPMAYAGWCFNSESCNRELQTTDVVIISSDGCDLLHSRDQFCTVNLRNDFEMGPGDSGSPLVYKNVLYGIIVGSLPNVTSPFISTKVFNHLDFIKQVLENRIR